MHAVGWPDLETVFRTAEGKHVNPDTYIFDMGGVVIKPRSEYPTTDYIARAFHVDPKKLHQAMKDGFLLAEVGRANIDELLADALAKLAPSVELAGRGYDLCAEAFRRGYTERPSVVEFIARLRGSGFKVFALTNTIAPHLDVMHEHGWNRLFDAFYASCEIGLRKPDPMCYRFLLNREGVDGSRAVFIDDRPENVAGAFEAGIRSGIIFKSSSNLFSELAKSLK